MVVGHALEVGARELAYEAPAIVWRDGIAEEEPIVWWAVFVGFAYVLALAWAAYCRHTGGDADISFSWTKGFKVSCYK